MKKRRKNLRSNKVIWILMSLAVVLLITSAVTGSRAALTYFSENYTAQLSVSQIGVTLLENGNAISSRDYSGGGDQWKETSGELLQNLLGKDEEIILGKKYDEELAVQNSGEIDQYVRVRVYKSWTKDGKKVTTLSPDLIDLNLTGSWIKDDANSTQERLVLYYPSILKGGETSSPFADTIRIDNKVAEKVTETKTTDENGYTTITTTYAYDGVTFSLEAEVNAVQTHNAQEAIKSAWGVDVNVASDGTISLK